MVTAVEAEARACAGPGREVVAAGVGPAAAAAATAFALSGGSYDIVLSAGIGGGFGAGRPGTVAAAASIVFADLGAESADGFLPVAALGWASAEYPVDPDVRDRLAERTGARVGTVLTVATVTGTAETAAALMRRHPDAVAEGMEGAGVAEAARRAGVPYGELRAISNPVGPRDRASWRIDDALAALQSAMERLP